MKGGDGEPLRVSQRVIKELRMRCLQSGTSFMYQLNLYFSVRVHFLRNIGAYLHLLFSLGNSSNISKLK